MPKEAKPKRKAVEKTETKTKKAPKEKGGPKRPLSAFMYFCKDWRERVKAENPEASFGEVGKLLGAKWKELDEQDKSSYLEDAARDKARYERQKDNGEGSAPVKKTKKAKVPSESAGEDDAGDDDDDE
ncbi:Non-histone chromosomal protein 6 [Tulasnella sp. 403]|nr:Non-histone chromosomal protein 6 [Tulasnella sp. 403]